MIISMVSNNPAGRLAYWIDRAFSAPGDVIAYDAWCQVFEVDTSGIEALSTYEVHVTSMIGQLLQLRDEVTRLPEDINADLFVSHLDQFDASFSRFSMAKQLSMAAFLGGISENGVTALKYFDRVLTPRSFEVSVNRDERITLINQVQDLIDEVRQAQLDDETKHFLVEHLLAVHNALNLVDLRGADDVAVAVDGVIGGLWRRPDLQAELEKEAQASEDNGEGS